MRSTILPWLKSERFNIGTLTTPAAFVLAIAVFGIFSPGHRFLDPLNLATLVRLAPDLGIVALGIGVLMICGEFDLSIASILPLCSFVFAQLLMAGLSPFVAFLIVIPCGAVLGLLNGVVVVRTALPSFIITLSTMMFWRGVLYVICGLMPISILTWVPTNSAFAQILTGQIGPVPVQFLWFLGLAVVLGIILHRTKFGNWVYATGSNVEAARAMGVRVPFTKVVCYMIVGVLCAFVAMLQSARIGSFAATQGIGFDLRAIAAVVVGGTSLRGGVGTMLNIALGIFILQIIDNGLILIKVPVFGINTFIGLAVILFVIVNSLTDRRFASR